MQCILYTLFAHLARKSKTHTIRRGAHKFAFMNNMNIFVRDMHGDGGDCGAWCTFVHTLPLLAKAKKFPIRKCVRTNYYCSAAASFVILGGIRAMWVAMCTGTAQLRSFCYVRSLNRCRKVLRTSMRMRFNYAYLHFSNKYIYICL